MCPLAEPTKMRVSETPCKNCAFAVYTDKDGVASQTDCYIGKLDKYRENGLIIEAYDEEKEFCVIKGHCNGFLNKSYLQVKPLDKAAEIVKQKITSRFCIILYVDENTTEHIFDETLISLRGVYYSQLIICVNCNRSFSETQLWMNKHASPRWSTCRVHEVGASFDRAIAIASKQIKDCNYVLFCKAGTKLPTNVFDKVDKALNEKAQRFVLVQNANFNVVFAPLMHYTPCNKEESPPIVEQIHIFATANNEEYLIKSFEEL